MRSAIPSLLVLALCFAPLVTAQDSSGLEQGFKPYGSYHGGDIDSISMVNLKPTINIPLISYPQRGGSELPHFFAHGIIRHSKLLT